MFRLGPAGADQPHSNKKVCLVATDRALLAGLLFELSLSADCYYVTFSIKPKARMYVGRCFLCTDRAAGELCQRLKNHPQLMVTVQDDDFFNRFRQAE